MSDALNTLVALLELEPLEETLFRGQSQDLGLPQLYGGQVLGQALAAATYTVPEDRRAHSQHGYFLRPGDPHRPVVYQVDNVRDGGSFTTRRVTAIQKGRPIFFCSASFHAREASITHQREMPEVASPEALLASGEAKRSRFPNHPIEFLHLPGNPAGGQPAGQCLWFRFAGGALPDTLALHRHLLSYASDFNLLTTSLVPHGIAFGDAQLRIASLDHALWLHDDTRLDDWLLYVIDSPWAGDARALARGQIYSRDGRLIASTAQEGLTRYQHAP
ncbi:acyl-CoA thioesterase [Halomonas dongshanensis]|uniref:Acyl-CoA thioesterase II n=1 Tax=Halomonas dongshanensis TaxID=2890835 RepID=A0ABT2EK31_9GAMM|nr:acyl-CoA thioesterase II [Halomonas dongshanensis]MCS2610927.1 acyl-CoA thioesterase II [Halomonas dongshanensis]